MSRQEGDFKKQAEIFADETQDSVEGKFQTRHDYLAGAEYGYQYAVEKATKWIGSHLLSSWQGEYLDDFRKAMKE